MKVIHCVSSIDNPAAGTTYSVDRLATVMRSLGVDAWLYTLGDPAENRAGGYLRRFSSDYAEIPVVSRLGCSRDLHDALFDRSIDLYHIHGLWQLPNIYPADVARRLDRPLMLSPHGMLGPAALRFSRAKKRVAWHLWQWDTLGQVDCFRATCHEEYREIRRLGLRQPTALIPNGIDPPVTVPRRRPLPRKRVITIGRIHPKKGLDRLVKAWAMVSEQFPDWELDIIGPDENGHAGELERLAASLGVERLGISGPLFEDAKLQALVDAELFALPTLNENFAMTVAESLVCGTPVISTKGAPWEGLETRRCGWWIAHGPEAMAAALRHAMALPTEERRAMGRRGQEWMKADFSWRVIGQKALEVKRWLVSGGTAPQCVVFD
ncbi:MAG: glycosyltransferase [Planctomycetes bacterium]|nr:glycosyltransferase [Planctomycetota bacterium]